MTDNPLNMTHLATASAGTNPGSGARKVDPMELAMGTARRQSIIDYRDNNLKPPTCAGTTLQILHTKSKAGLKEATSPSFYGGDSTHILTYDPALTMPFLSILLRRDLTVCSSIFSWLYHLILVVYALVLMLILGYNAFPDGEMGDGTACTTDSTHNHQMCQLNGQLIQAKGDFRFLIAFILAGYVGVTVTTWAVRRKNYAALCGNARNLAMLLSAAMPLDSSDEYIRNTRLLLGRWVMLAFELSILKARSHMDSEEGREHLLREGLIVPGEWEAMVPGDRHSTVLWWIQFHLTHLQREEGTMLDTKYVIMIINSISDMRAQANDLMSSLDRDKPFPYVAICGVLVQLNVFIFSTWKGVEWSIWLFSFGDDLVNQPKFWVDILVLLAWNVSYMALYDLGYMLHNPFGNRRVDVAHELIFAGVRKLAMGLAEGVDHLPPSLAKKK